MFKEIKYLIFFLVIIIFILFSIKFYISDENKKKTFRNLNSVENNMKLLKNKLPVILNDTDETVKYLNNEDNSLIKEFTFWELLKNEN
tara:strand:+ start:491 stop:754 length:264 start_codon:yes stop_codon:yes gene_type:complete